jgi:hypothetical protein
VGGFLFTRKLFAIQGEENEFERDDTTPELWRQAQEECEECKWKIKMLMVEPELRKEIVTKGLNRKRARSEWHEFNSHTYSIRDNVLYEGGRRVVPRVLSEKVKQTPPDENTYKHLRTHLVAKAHGTHHDLQLTRQILQNEWGVTWPNMEKDLAWFHANCVLCQVDSPVPVTMSYHTEIYDKRNFTWFMDHQGPFGPANNQFYLLTIIDDASGYGWITKVSDKEAGTVVKVLRKLFLDLIPAKLPSSMRYAEGIDPVAPRIPENLRADNGFRKDITKFCQEFATEFKLERVTQFREGTAENPTSQHRIERPHKHFRKWLAIKQATMEGKWWEKDGIDGELQFLWRQRPMYGKFIPHECYFGKEPRFECSLQEAQDYRRRTQLALNAEMAAVRHARAEARKLKFLETHGIKENVIEDGDLVLYTHLNARRKSKRSFLGNYRKQIFKVVATSKIQKSRPDRVFLEAASGDKGILFKLPVNSKKLKKVNECYKPWLVYPSDDPKADRKEQIA